MAVKKKVAKKKAARTAASKKNSKNNGKLRDKRKVFVAEYLKDFNATQAAIRAGYSKKTAKSQGQRLLTYADVSRAIAEGSEKITEKAQIDEAEVLQRALHYLDTNIAQFMDIHEHGGVPTFNFSKATPEQLGVLDSVEISPGQYGTRIKVSLPKRKEMLELIGKHKKVQAFHDGGEGEVTDNRYVINIMVNPDKGSAGNSGT